MQTHQNLYQHQKKFTQSVDDVYFLIDSLLTKELALRIYL